MRITWKRWWGGWAIAAVFLSLISLIIAANPLSPGLIVLGCVFLALALPAVLFWFGNVLDSSKGIAIRLLWLLAVFTALGFVRSGVGFVVSGFVVAIALRGGA